MKDAIIEIFGRDILKLSDEINKYKVEKNIWITDTGISNSAGNLCLHLVGNLNHFIGAVLGKNGYTRERELEFSSKDIPREKLIGMITSTRDMVIHTLTNMTVEEFDLDFPEAKYDKILKTKFMLLHLLAHFNYHLGQINYHRRLLEK